MLQSSCGTDLTLAQIIAPLGGNINRLPCLLLPSGRRQKTERKLQTPDNPSKGFVTRFFPTRRTLVEAKRKPRGWLNTALSAWKEPGSQSRRWCKLCGIPAITIYLHDILALLLLFSLSLEPIHNWIHCYPKRKRVLFSQNLCCSNPCWNNAKCLLGFTDKKYLCVCTSGYTGEHCETGIVEKLIVTGHIAGNNMQWITKPLNTPLKGKQKQANQFVGWEF